MNEIASATICQWDEARFLFFSDNIWGDFIYYSHLLPAISALIVTIFVFLHATQNKSARALLFIGLSFVAWSLMDLFLWSSEKIDLIMFVWSSLIYFELFVYIGSLYFIHAHIENKFLSFRSEIFLFTLFLPLFLFGHTALNLTGFDLTNCWREAIEGPLWQYYIYYIELFIGLWILVYAISHYRRLKDVRRRKEIIVVTTGTILFLTSFSLGNIIGSVETDWEIGQIGLFGMPILLSFIGYSIVKYESFRLKVLAVEALFTVSFILLLSVLFIRSYDNTRIIILGTLVLFSILGFLLVKNVRKEIEQKEEIKRLVVKLESANERLQELDKLKSEFVSIASHQLRSPLTSIRGYSSLLLDGSYGKMPAQAIEPLTRIDHSSKLMAVSIEDYLNVSRIESGNMKYINSDFNLVDEVEQVCDGLRTEAVKKGLALIFRTDLKSRGIINADIGKTVQIIGNLVNNSLKYTPQGSIKVLVRDDVVRKKIYVDIMDTGIGMSQKTLGTVFQKFERAENANSVNSTGTGLGLYVALRMAEGMGGTITAHSEGDGKGSRFTFEYPLAL